MKALLLLLVILVSCNKDNICSISMVPPPPAEIGLPDSINLSLGMASYIYFTNEGYTEYRYTYVGNKTSCWNKSIIRKLNPKQ